MYQKDKNEGKQKLPHSVELEKKIKNEEMSSEYNLQEHENPSKTSTPLKEHYPLLWWVKWVSSIIMVFAMIATTNDLYPWNMFLQFAGVTGWLWVSIVWNDRALIVVNAVACAIFINGVVMYFLKLLG